MIVEEETGAPRQTVCWVLLVQCLSVFRMTLSYDGWI